MVTKQVITGTLDRSLKGRKANPPAMTPEILEKARIARAANAAVRRASTLRDDFFDATRWEEIAKERKLRLPPPGQACTVARMRSWLRKIGVSQTAWERESGCSLARWIVLNPDWSMRPFAGVTIEA